MREFMLGNRQSNNAHRPSKFCLLPVFIGCMLGACNKEPIPPSAPSSAKSPEVPPDVLLWQSDKEHLLIAINGIPVRFVQSDESATGLMEVSQFEKADGNILDVLAFQTDLAKAGTASVDICEHSNPGNKLTKLTIAMDAGDGEKRASAKFDSVGTPHWFFGEAEDVGELSAADEKRILGIVSEYQNAFQHKDVEGVVSITKAAIELNAKLADMSSADAILENKQNITNAFSRVSQCELQTVDQLKLVKFQYGIMVLAKNYKPFLKLSDPKNDGDAVITVKSLVFCKQHNQWILIK